MPQNTDPRNTPNYDPRTGQYHADPKWQRYQQPPQPLSNIPRNVLAGLKGLFPVAGQGEGGSASGSPYDMSRARRAAGATSQIGKDINLDPSSASDIELPNEVNQRADAINATSNSNYFDDMLRYPASSPSSSPSSSSSAAPALEGLKMNAPRTMPGAGTPMEAMQTFTGSSTANQAPSDMASGLKPTDWETPEGWENLGSTPGLDPENLSDLFRLANRDPNTVATGSNEYWQDELRTRQGESDFKLAQEQAAAKALQAAQQGGFGSVPEAEAEAREAETYKVNAPVRAQEAAGRADIEKQRLAGETAKDVANIQQSGIASRYGAMQDLLQGGGFGNLRSMNPSTGSFSLSPTPQIPSPILNAVTAARQTLAKAVQNKPLIGGGAAIATAQDQVRAAIDTALSVYRIDDPEAKQEIQAALIDPANRGKKIEEVFDVSQMSPEEQAQLSSFVALIGGFQ